MLRFRHQNYQIKFRRRSWFGLKIIKSSLRLLVIKQAMLADENTKDIRDTTGSNTKFKGSRVGFSYILQTFSLLLSIV